MKSADLPEIHISADSVHSTREPSLVEYHIPPAPGVVLDVSVLVQKNANDSLPFEPNMIQLALDNAHIYAAAWERDIDRYTLSPDTLVPLFGAPSFPGLLSKASAVIAIGRYSLPENEQSKARFSVLWLGKIIIG